MKVRFLTLLFLASLFAVSCKIDKKEDAPASTTGSATTKESTGAGVKVTFNAIVDKDDTFQLFYNEDGTEKFDGEQMIELPVKGNSAAQDLVFTLPDDAAPLNFRFDIGSNPAQKQVKFEGFKVEFNGKPTVSVSGKEFFKYFYPNDQVVCDTVTSTAKIIIKADHPYDPIIGGTGEMQNELAKLFK